MYKNRVELEHLIIEQSKRIIFDNKKRLNSCENIYLKYNIPTGKTTEIMSQNVNISDVNDWILFCLTEELLPELLEEFFTKKEISNYSKMTYEAPHSINFPFEIKMVQIDKNQWIGSATSNLLIGLFLEKKIHYNEKTQRVMTKISSNNIEYWKPTVNESAVNAIAKSMESKNFIPNTITLNICENCDEDSFSFNQEESTFVLNSNIEFDITDGYHRFLAMQKNYAFNEDFIYPIELRIIRFDEKKAQQMIYQEDQKTKMKKIASNSFNMSSESNKIVERLNDFGSVLEQKIGRNNNIVDYTILSEAISKCYVKKTKKTDDDKSYQSIVVTELKKKFALVEDNIPNIYAKKLSDKLVSSFIYIFSNENEPNELIRKCDYIVEKENILIETTSGRVNSKKFFSEVDSVLEGVDH